MSTGAIPDAAFKGEIPNANRADGGSFGGYQCQKCGWWVSPGATHNCDGTTIMLYGQSPSPELETLREVLRTLQEIRDLLKK